MPMPTTATGTTPRPTDDDGDRESALKHKMQLLQYMALLCADVFSRIAPIECNGYGEQRDLDV